MVVKDLVEEIASVMAGELGVPDQPVDLPDADGLDGILAVINAEPGLEIDGILADLIFDQEDQLLLLQQGPEVQDLEIGAEDPPVRRYSSSYWEYTSAASTGLSRFWKKFRLTTGCRRSKGSPKVSVSTVKGM